MLPLNQNEVAALQMILHFISLRELLNAAQIGFDNYETVKDTENADLCFKVVKSFLE